MVEMKTLRKPKMRGLYASFLKFNVTTACLLSIAAGYSYYRFVGLERKRKYKEFYENYDAEKAADEMARKGLFQSSPIA